MKSISFCIATGVNEKEYLKLLLRSLKDNTELENHEILVWVDTDNQNTYKELINYQKNDFPMLKIGKNPYSSQLGNQLNSSVMAKEAKNEIICFLHSDMVVGNNFDKEVLIALDNNPNNLVCSARIEPPLHPPSPEKIIKDFGLSPEKFQYDEFQKYTHNLSSENRKNGKGYFAPCTLYKSTFLDILGGFDTQFRCSREDSDFIIKIEMNHLNPIISWKAVVYHFTCTSSRGKEWFKKEEDITAKVNWQKRADNIEMKRFMRKWGYFGHYYSSRYDIGLSLDMDCIPDFNLLFYIEPYVNKLIINDIELVKNILNHLEFSSHYYSNKKLGHIVREWKDMKNLFVEKPFNERIIHSDSLENNSQVKIKTKMSILIKELQRDNKNFQNFFENINQIVTQNQPGEYQMFDGVTIEIKDNLIDINKDNITNNNLKLILEKNKFEFEE